MPTVEAREDEIIQTELPAAEQRRALKLFAEAPFTTCVLLALENWLRDEVGDEKAARIVEQATLKMATHEAETT
jgi:hypothetical protein